jgi:hypothetical protein
MILMVIGGLGSIFVGVLGLWVILSCIWSVHKALTRRDDHG